MLDSRTASQDHLGLVYEGVIYLCDTCLSCAEDNIPETTKDCEATLQDVSVCWLGVSARSTASHYLSGAKTISMA